MDAVTSTSQRRDARTSTEIVATLTQTCSMLPTVSTTLFRSVGHGLDVQTSLAMVAKGKALHRTTAKDRHQNQVMSEAQECSHMLAALARARAAGHVSNHIIARPKTTARLAMEGTTSLGPAVLRVILTTGPEMMLVSTHQKDAIQPTTTMRLRNFASLVNLARLLACQAMPQPLFVTVFLHSFS